MIVVCAPRVVRYITFNFARAIALYPFVLLRYPQDQWDARLINHEKIHIRQQRELLVLPFYGWYLIEYVRHRLRGAGHMQAYLSICFEREAFCHEQDLAYLQHRTPFAFWKYRK